MYGVGVRGELMSLNRKLLDYSQAESKAHLDLFWSLYNVTEPQMGILPPLQTISSVTCVC